jgi:hypothetical protein
VLRLLVTAKVVPSSPILVALMMEALPSSETSVLTRAARRNIPNDGILRYIWWLGTLSFMGTCVSMVPVVVYVSFCVICGIYNFFTHAYNVESYASACPSYR